MNRAEKKVYRIEKISNFYNQIEERIKYNQKDYEEYLQRAEMEEDESSKKYYTDEATLYIEKNEVLTELLNEIYKML